MNIQASRFGSESGPSDQPPQGGGNPLGVQAGQPGEGDGPSIVQHYLRIAQRWRWLILGSIAACVALGLVATLLMPATFVSLAISSFGLGVFCVASLAKLNDSAPQHLKGTVSSAYYLAWGFGYVLGPMMIGTVDRMIVEGGYWVLCLLMAVEAITLAVLRGVPARKG